MPVQQLHLVPLLQPTNDDKADHNDGVREGTGAAVPNHSVTIALAKTHTTIGRVEIVKAFQAATTCTCPNKRHRSDCPAAASLNWAKHYLPRQLLRVVGTNSENKEDSLSAKDAQGATSVELATHFARDYVRINDKPPANLAGRPGGDWTPQLLHAGDVIMLLPPPSTTHNNTTLRLRVVATVASPGMEPSAALTTGTVPASDAGTGAPLSSSTNRDIVKSGVKDGTDANDVNVDNNDNDAAGSSSAAMVSTDAVAPTDSATVIDKKANLERRVSDVAVNKRRSSATTLFSNNKRAKTQSTLDAFVLHNSPTKNVTKPAPISSNYDDDNRNLLPIPRFDSTSVEQRRSLRKSNPTPTTTLSDSAAPLPADETTAHHGHVNRGDVKSAARSATAADDGDATIRIYFVPKGRDMHRSIIQQLQAKVAGRPHTEIAHTFDMAHPPTHMVISETLLDHVNVVIAHLGFASQIDLELYLGAHRVVPVTKRWILNNADAAGIVPLPPPTSQETFVALWPRRHSNSKSQRGLSGNDKGSKTETSAAAPTGAAPGPPARNQAVADMFLNLGKLYQAAPVGDLDNWKAYTFTMVAGRLRRLDFDIVNERRVLDRTKQIDGIGPSTLDLIKEFLQTGTTMRLATFYDDPQRAAMKAMMNIWGVGRVKAMELVKHGYETIEQVRHDLEHGRLTLDRNQYIGVDIYDDLLEEMDRREVEQIGNIVKDAFGHRFPQCELTIMGSYRRGKAGCGDVDMLITSPQHYEQVPPRALGEVVDDLRAQGHVAFHLTFIAGMDPDKFETLPPEVAHRLTKPSHLGRSHDKKDKFSSSTYMGVFYSPKVPGRRRRVDLKFYPMREKAFAQLYFTGNGHFNRSMRLWATRKFHWTLSDHGLFYRNTTTRVMDATDERQVFDRLGLVWKEPVERDGFDAVVSQESGETASQLQGLTQAELYRESQEAWIA